MRLAIMQPYFFPYIGYFQLINSVDKFVFYDDVNYIKSGWINRNRLFFSHSVRYITVPLSGASSFKKINETRIKSGAEWSESIHSIIHQYYSTAPYYYSVRNIIENVLGSHDGLISTLAKNSVISVASYLGMEKDFVHSSSCYDNQKLKGADRVLDICRLENAREYWNLPGGKNMYKPEIFLNQGVELKFIDLPIKPYRQISSLFQPSLSVIDVLMFNDRELVKAMLSVEADK